MDDRPAFDLAVSQNKYLSIEDNEMHAVVTVGAPPGLAEALGPGGAEAAEVIAIDCSGSMEQPPTKIRAARRATMAAIDALRDGVRFAVVSGRHTATMVYPTGETLAVASEQTRTAAKDQVRHLEAEGGTAMGSWLLLAGRLLDHHPAAVRHVLLLTDGKNEHESPAELDEILGRCTGKFVCDARGIGENWVPEELLRIVSALHGSADAIRRHGDLVDEFTALTHAAMAKVLPDLRLQIRTMPSAHVRFVKQTYPTEIDLTGMGVAVDERTTRYSTGSWGGGQEREYHVCLRCDRGDLDLHTDFQAARLDLVIVRAGGKAEPQAVAQPIRAQWTEDPKLSSVIDSKVAHYTHQTELGQAVMAGCRAHDKDDLELAEAEWGRAVALAARLGNEKVLTRLGRLVDIIGDPADGVVRIKEDLARSDLLSAAMSSVMSTRSVVRYSEQDVAVEGRDLTCPRCTRLCRPGARFCEQCGHELGDSA